MMRADRMEAKQNDDGLQSVAVFQALVQDRPYRKGLPPEDVRNHIQADSGKHFDPNVVKAFLS